MTTRHLPGRNGSELETRRGARSDLRVTYTPRPDATPEGELSTLAAIYAFVIRAHEQKKAAAPATMRRQEVDPEERRQGRDK